MSYLKRNFKFQFKKEIEVLNGEEFEIFCKHFMEFVLGETIEHKGQNLLAKPVKNTVDFSNLSYKISGQAGTEKGYFDEFSKPKSDLKKALDQNPNVEEIWLISNQYAVTSRLPILQREITDLSLPCQVEIFDSERIAEELMRGAYRLDLKSDLFTRLPVSKNLLSIFPNNVFLPSNEENYISRIDEEEGVKLLLQKRTHIQIYGLSGSGKTQLTISVANSIKSEYETTIWLDSAFSGNKTINFEAVQLERYEKPINLATILETYKILLIIDNQNSSVESIVTEFMNLNKKGSKLIFTSLRQSLPPEDVFLVSGVSEKVAEEILRSNGELPDEEIRKNIYKHTGKSPLLLQIICKTVSRNIYSWEKIDQLLNELGEVIDDNRSIKVSQRLIGEYVDVYNKELSFIKLVNNTKINRLFAKELIGQIGIDNLINIALVESDDTRYLTIHHIILDSIDTVFLAFDFDHYFGKKVHDFLWRNKDIKGIDYYNVLYQHRDMLDAIFVNSKNEDLRRLIIYSILQATNIRDKIEMDKLFALAGEFDESKANIFDYLILIEKMEYEFSALPYEGDFRVVFAEKCVVRLTKFEQAISDSEILLIIYHHSAKFMSKCDKVPDAIRYYQRILDQKPSDPFVLLQLMRIYQKLENNEHERRIISQIFGLEEVPLSILLATYEHISSIRYSDLHEEYIDSKIEKFTEIITSSINGDYDHPYRILGGLAKHLLYNCPTYFAVIVQSLPIPAKLEKNKELSINYAKILSAYYILLKSQNEENERGIIEEERNRIFYIAEKCYLEAIKNDFDKKAYIELLIEAQTFDKALEIWETMYKKDGIYNLQLKCKILRGMKRYDESLVAINTTIEKALEEKVHSSHMAAFYHDKAETLLHMNNLECIDMLEIAIDKQDSEITKKWWSDKLGEWQKKFGITPEDLS